MVVQLKRSRDSQHSTLALTGLDGWVGEARFNQLAGHVSPLLDLCKNPNEDDGCRVNQAVERLVALSVPGQVVILGTKTQGQNKIV